MLWKSMLLLLLSGPVLAAAEPSVQLKPLQGRTFDVIVIGGTPGGIACAVRAARLGCSVLLVHHHQHVGGFMTSGAGGWEAPYDGLRSPIYAEIRTGATEHYRKTYGEDSQQVKASRPHPTHNSHLERPKIEPRVCEKLFNKMLDDEPNILVFRGYYVDRVEREGALIKAMSIRTMVGGELRATVPGRIFVDATYEGDLAAAAQVPYRVGRESRDEYKEPHAGVIFAKERHKEKGQHGFPLAASEGTLKIRHNSHATGELLDHPEAGQGDKSVMAYNFRPILTNDPANRVMIEKPENYDPEILKKASAGGFVPNLPNNKVAWNSGRLIGPQNEYPEASWPRRREIEKQYRDALLSLLWYYQNDPRASEADRKKYKDYGLAKDEFADNNNFPYEIYVREARRIVGRHVFTEHDAVLAPDLERTPLYPDSIAITDWPLDSVACLSRTLPGAKNDGIFFLGEEIRPAQVSYRTLLPKGVDNLLVPVCLSASHVGWGAIRLEPVWMQTGEAAGFAAALALRDKTTPAALGPELISRALVEAGMMVSFFNDVDVTSDEPWVAAIEYLGGRGFFRSYDAKPKASLTVGTAEVWVATFGKLAAGGEFDPLTAAKLLPPQEKKPIERVTVAAFCAQLAKALPSERKGQDPTTVAKRLELQPEAAITRGEACRLMYVLLSK